MLGGFYPPDACLCPTNAAKPREPKPHIRQEMDESNLGCWRPLYWSGHARLQSRTGEPGHFSGYYEIRIKILIQRIISIDFDWK